MKLSHPADHVWMVEQGWDHETLNRMDEEEFLFLLQTRIDIEEARAAAIEAASED